MAWNRFLLGKMKSWRVKSGLRISIGGLVTKLKPFFLLSIGNGLLPLWLRVFNIRCFDWWSMKVPTLWMNPSAAPSVTSCFQPQGLWLMKQDRTHTTDEPFGCPLCDWVFNIRCSDLWSMKVPTLWMNPSAASSVTSCFQPQVLWLIKQDRIHTRDEPFGCPLCDFEFSTTGALIDEAWKKPH